MGRHRLQRAVRQFDIQAPLIYSATAGPSIFDTSRVHIRPFHLSLSRAHTTPNQRGDRDKHTNREGGGVGRETMRQ